MPTAAEIADLARRIETEFTPHWNRSDDRGDLFDRLVAEKGRKIATKMWMDACDLLERMRTEAAAHADAPAGLPDVNPDAVRELHRDFTEMDDSGTSSNDVVQMLDDWFTEHGYPTVIYRPRRRRRNHDIH